MPDGKVNSIDDRSNTALLRNRKTVLSSNAQMSMTDFYKIMAAQLKYQDPSSPVDSSDMLNQMTQMSMISSIENMNTMIMTSYTTSMIGKEVTIAVKQRDSNKVEEVKGVVTGVNLSGKETTVWVNGKEYRASQIMQIGQTGKKEDKKKPENKGGGTAAPGSTTTSSTTNPNGTTTSNTGIPSGTASTISTQSVVESGNNGNTTLTEEGLSTATDPDNTEAVRNASSEDINIGEKLTPINAALKHISATGTNAENAMPPMTIIEDNGVEEKTLPKYNEQENKNKIITPVG